MKENVLFRVTKTRREKNYQGNWYVAKHEVAYVTRESDVKNAVNYADKYSTEHCKYEVEVEVAFMPRFHDYNEVKELSPTSLVIGILKARGRAARDA